MNYQYRAVEKFWRNFHALGSEQKESIRRAWRTFKRDPFHPSLRSLGGVSDAHATLLQLIGLN